MKTQTQKLCSFQQWTKNWGKAAVFNLYIESLNNHPCLSQTTIKKNICVCSTKQKGKTTSKATSVQRVNELKVTYNKAGGKGDAFKVWSVNSFSAVLQTLDLFPFMSNNWKRCNLTLVQRKGEKDTRSPSNLKTKRAPSGVEVHSTQGENWKKMYPPI